MRIKKSRGRKFSVNQTLRIYASVFVWRVNFYYSHETIDQLEVMKFLLQSKYSMARIDFH